jgi:hypothetical protein
VRRSSPRDDRTLARAVMDKLRKMLAFLFLPEVLKVASELTDSFHVAA